MKIRSVTVGVNLSYPPAVGEVRRAGMFACQARAEFTRAGVEVQTLRLTIQPCAAFLATKSQREVVGFARELEGLCRESSLEYCSLGPTNVAGAPFDSSLLRMVPEVIAATETIFASVSLATTTDGLQPPIALEAAKVIHAISRHTAGGFGNLRFAATANCPPHIPFFPASYHQGVPAFSLALEAADLIAEALRGSSEAAAIDRRVVEVMEERLFPLQEIARRLEGNGYAFRGFDLSPAPGPGSETSIAYALEELGLGRFGEPGTLTATALVAGALKNTSLQTCGYCGLMLPVLEDSGLAERNNEGLLHLSSLLSYSAICGTGLDTIPLPGDVTVEQLAAILLDVATLAVRLKKPLSARLFPIPGKKEGDMTEFDFPYFLNTRVMGLG